MPDLAVACVKWGKKFPPDYVNVLFRAVKDQLSLPHRFVCVTDNAEGLDAGIEVHPFPTFRVPRETWRKSSFPKLAAMAPGIFSDDAIVLQIDLDVMVVGDLSVFFDLWRERPAFYSLREWNPVLVRTFLPQALWPDRGTQGSVYLYRMGDQRHMLAHFEANTEDVFATHISDRHYFPTVARDPAYLPPEWVPSFKNSCLWYWPVNLVAGEPRPPQGARIIAFHGRPRPADLLGPEGRRWGTSRKFGHGPVSWVVAYWRRYGGSLPAG